MATYKMAGGKTGTIVIENPYDWEIETDYYYKYKDISYLDLYRKGRVALRPYSVPPSVSRALMEAFGVNINELAKNGRRIELEFQRRKEKKSVSLIAKQVRIPLKNGKDKILQLSEEERRGFTDLLEDNLLHHVEVTCECCIRSSYDLVVDETGLEELYHSDSPVLNSLFKETEREFKKCGPDNTNYAVYDNDQDATIIDWD